MNTRMQNNQFVCCLALAFSLMGGFYTVKAADTNPPPVVSISEVLAAKEKWNLRRVEVRGFYAVRVEFSAIYSTANELKDPYLNATNGLWVSYAGAAAKVQVIRNGYVRIVGMFEFHPEGSGHLNGWPAEITKLEVLELLRSPRTNRSAPTLEKGKTPPPAKSDSYSALITENGKRVGH